MKKYVCLRDDDTNYYTSIDELSEGYGEIWGKIPITLGTVPFSHGSQQKMMEFESKSDRYKALREWELSATAEQLSEYHKLHPIGDNKPLTDEIKKQVNRGMIEIAQHGVSHRYNEYGAETTISQVTLPMIRDGMEYLSKLFCTKINAYIPPSNTIDVSCAKYVDSLGMFLFSSGGISYSSSFNKVMGYVKEPETVVKKIFDKSPQPIRRRDGIDIVGSYTYDNFKSQNHIYDTVINSLNKTGFAAIGTHYMLLNSNGYNGEHKEYRSLFLGLIQKLSELPEVEFVLVSDYYKLLKKGNINN